MFMAALFIITKIWNWLKCPSMAEQIKKTSCVCVCVCIQILFSLNKGNPVIYENMDKPGG